MTKEERIRLNKSRYNVYAQYRDAKGYNDHKISLVLGIPKSSISDWKKGYLCPKAERLYELCAFLEMPMGKVLAGDTSD